jgi:hypothetical protein
MDHFMYLASLPKVKTMDLGLGALFWADNRLYEVIEIDAKGYSRARQWRKEENTDVALIPNSPLAARLRLISEGLLLPAFKSRNELLQNGRPLAYVFPDEQLALDAAYLDVALCGRAGGVYVRRHPHFPAFEATNGLNVVRSYFFMRTRQGFDTRLTDLKQRLGEALIPHIQGAAAWRLLNSWHEGPYNIDETIAMRPINLTATLEELAPKTPPGPPTTEDTQRNLKIPPE